MQYSCSNRTTGQVGVLKMQLHKHICPSLGSVSDSNARTQLNKCIEPNARDYSLDLI